jgi:hypothetical protein
MNINNEDTKLIVLLGIDARMEQLRSKIGRMTLINDTPPRSLQSARAEYALLEQVGVSYYEEGTLHRTDELLRALSPAQ